MWMVSRHEGRSEYIDPCPYINSWPVPDDGGYLQWHYWVADRCPVFINCVLCVCDEDVRWHQVLDQAPPSSSSTSETAFPEIDTESDSSDLDVSELAEDLLDDE